MDLQNKIGFVFLTSGEGARQGEVGRSQETETEKGGGRGRRGRDRETLINTGQTPSNGFPTALFPVGSLSAQGKHHTLNVRC